MHGSIQQHINDASFPVHVCWAIADGATNEQEGIIRHVRVGTKALEAGEVGQDLLNQRLSQQGLFVRVHPEPRHVANRLQKDTERRQHLKQPPDCISIGWVVAKCLHQLAADVE